MDAWLKYFTQADDTYVYVFQTIIRYVLPLLVFGLVLHTAKPLLTFRREPEVWGFLCLESGKKIALTHWESVIGRSKRSDVVLNAPTVSRTHAVLTRYDDGSWSIADAGSKTGVTVNDEAVEFQALEEDDVINVGGVQMRLQPISSEQESMLAKLRTKAASPLDSIFSVLFLTLIQVIICVSYLMSGAAEYAGNIFFGFAGIIVLQWMLLIFYLCIRKPAFQVETIALFLCTLGMAAIAASKPDETIKQLIALVMGIGAYLGVGWAVRDLERAKKLRYYAAAAGVMLLIITLLFGKEYHGAKNWLVIGSLSLQPSELSKVCFVFVGASTMDRIVNKRNIFLFILYTVSICACLAVMNDFGTALIFFVAFLLIAFLRSGSVGTIALALTALGFGGVLILKIAPHALRRFESWRHIWENPLGAGYQQTRALMCLASGGLFGLGAGNGWMKHIFAADSDMVVATVGEEWGLLMVLICVGSIIALALFAMRTAAVSRSSFYAIGACTAAGILLMQTIFNALGTLDILPLTGVTFPFLSNGGSSMICSWGLLAFIKASDTRQYASFAVRQFRERRRVNE